MVDTKGGDNMENEYEMKVEFLDDEGYVIEIMNMKTIANSSEDAQDNIEQEILENIELYPSDEWDAEIIDVH